MVVIAEGAGRPQDFFLFRGEAADLAMVDGWSGGFGKWQSGKKVPRLCLAIFFHFFAVDHHPLAWERFFRVVGFGRLKKMKKYSCGRPSVNVYKI